jgi:GDP-L-fucose synthase
MEPGNSMKIYVAGHRGLVGSALVRAIESTKDHTWVGRTRKELDLLDRAAVFEYVQQEKPDWVIIAAAKVGGIHANATFPVEFLSENLQIETNLLDACHAADIERVLFLGSSCIYPKVCPQPIREEYLLTGPLEPTNEAYALAKISGLKLVQAYRKQYGHRWISAMPTNLYGPGDNFDLQNSHVLPALIRRFHEAKISRAEEVTLWGTGAPMREFLHSDDLASACLHLLSNYDGPLALNVGTGTDQTISDLANRIKSIVGYEGSVRWDSSKPDGTMRKVLDVRQLAESGWSPKITLDQGLEKTYFDYLQSLG